MPKFVSTPIGLIGTFGSAYIHGARMPVMPTSLADAVQFTNEETNSSPDDQ